MGKYTNIETGETNLYIEGVVRPEMRGGHISDAAYGEVLDHMIIACVDAVIVNKKNRTVWLAKRTALPHNDIWWIGGRRRKGETPTESIQRCFKRETGLNIMGERFHYVTVLEYIWKDRQQEPRERGCHAIAHQFYIELSGDELDTVRKQIEDKEYDADFGLREFNRKQLVDENVHPAVLQVYDQIFGA